MIPHELVLRNFMCYRGEQHPLQFDGLHVACLSGENGAGKSALLDAITWVLWGEARMSHEELVAQGESDMWVDMTFVLNDQYYRVIRHWQRTHKGGRSANIKHTLDLQVRQEDLSWRTISELTMTDTARKIEDLLRMKYDTFINASFLLQGRADEFTRKIPSKRKEVLADILDLGEYAMLEKRAKEKAKVLDGQVKTLDGVISGLRQQAEKSDFYAQLVQEAEARVATLSESLETTEQERESADEQVRALEAKQTRRKEIRQRLDALQKNQHEAEQEIAKLHGEIQQAETLLARRNEIATGVQALEQAQQTLDHLETLRPRYEELKEQRRQLQEALKDEKYKLQSQIDRLQDEIQRLQEQIGQRPTLEAALAKHNQRLEALEPLVQEMQSVREQMAERDTRLSRANTLLLQHSELMNAIAHCRSTLEKERTTQQEAVTRLERQLKDVPRWEADLETAMQQQQQVQTLSADLAALRTREQTISEQAGELRALSTQHKKQADDMKKRQGLLADADTTTCPLCSSDLGDDGVATVVSHYEQEIHALLEQYSTGKKEAKKLDVTLTDIRKGIQAHESQLADAQKGAARVESLQHSLAQASEWQADLEQTRVALATVEQQLATEDYERESHEALLTVNAELGELGAVWQEHKPQRSKRKGADGVEGGWSVQALEQQRKDLQQRQARLEKQLESRTKVESDRATVQYQLEAIEQAVAKLPQVENEYATVDATIKDGDFGHEIRIQGRAVEAQMAELGYTREEHDAAHAQVKDLLHWTEEQHKLDVATSTLERDRRVLERTQELLERYRLEHADLRTEDTHLEQELRAYPGAKQHAEACAAKVVQHRQELDVSKRDLTEKQTHYGSAQKAHVQLAEKDEERQQLAERQGVFDELAEACGKKGVQAMLIETAIPEIEREANRLLGRMTDNQMHVCFDMQRDKKSGGTSETLDIKISDTLGTRIYNAFSGGEAMRINFAVRVALSRLLARRAGASLETLVIDEGFGMLDAEGRERFVEAISGVQQDFKLVLVITHIEDLKDRFPSQIMITKTPRGSTWELM